MPAPNDARTLSANLASGQPPDRKMKTEEVTIGKNYRGTMADDHYHQAALEDLPRVAPRLLLRASLALPVVSRLADVVVGALWVGEGGGGAPATT